MPELFAPLVPVPLEPLVPLLDGVLLEPLVPARVLELGEMFAPEDELPAAEPAAPAALLVFVTELLSYELLRPGYVCDELDPLLLL